ncbi:hypothetical protein J2S05_003952 [Alkalicoccobacillus murimartini]|uniref:Uncharacterized protein n=1 Tax=Alkalicoccobacillus murimartini TaxID=171685 RepID=A0ABT9YMN6_9BACI|nr:hypothetical protein [Alkalicoccobacillus murimartini]
MIKIEVERLRASGGYQEPERQYKEESRHYQD